jgi:hypothetical protein
VQPQGLYFRPTWEIARAVSIQKVIQ